MSKIDEIIRKLKELNLSNYPHKEVKDLLNLTGNIGIIRTVYRPGQNIIRGRVNEKNASFQHVTELSYKPAHLNTTYYRASTPNKSMFYGAIIPEHRKPEEINQAYVTVSFEISKFLRDLEKSGKVKITFSKWEVIEPISVVSILFHKDYIEKTKMSEEVNKGFETFIKRYPELRDDTIKLNNFISGEFAKIEVNEDWKYLISAIYSEIIVENGFDGVLYPSVQMDGKGFNIALTPDCIDNKLSPTLMAEVTIYKKEKKMILDWELICQLEANQTELKFIPDRLKIGEEMCLNVLNDK